MTTFSFRVRTQTSGRGADVPWQISSGRTGGSRGFQVRGERFHRLVYRGCRLDCERWCPHGKLALAWPREDIHFNLSHTGDLALVAIAGSGRVGVGAETVQPEIEIEDLSRRFFHLPRRPRFWRCPLTRAWRRFSPAGSVRRPSLRRSAAACPCH